MQKNKAIVICILLQILFASTGYNQVAINKPVLLNNISLTTTGGFVVDSAYLLYEDFTPIDKGNSTLLNKKIILWLIIKKGWTVIDGNIRVGASETILNDRNEVILKQDELFPDGNDIASLEDARYISLKAVITEITKKIPYFKVNFSVWDKNGKGKITGTYRFVVKNQ